MVLAKEPRPGFSKTRLTPPLTPGQACMLATAALQDTIDAVLQVGATRNILCLEGTPPPWLPASLEVIPQQGHGLAQRLEAAFDDVGCPAFLVAMDTPQVTALHLAEALDLLAAGAGSTIGLTDDGGYWGIGFSRPIKGAFSGVPMSSSSTGQAQIARLSELGKTPRLLPSLRDVDQIEDALAVASGAPHTHFAGRLRSLMHTPVTTG